MQKRRQILSWQPQAIPLWKLCLVKTQLPSTFHITTFHTVRQDRTMHNRCKCNRTDDLEADKMPNRRRLKKPRKPVKKLGDDFEATSLNPNDLASLATDRFAAFSNLQEQSLIHRTRNPFLDPTAGELESVARARSALNNFNSRHPPLDTLPQYPKYIKPEPDSDSDCTVFIKKEEDEEDHPDAPDTLDGLNFSFSDCRTTTRIFPPLYPEEVAEIERAREAAAFQVELEEGRRRAEREFQQYQAQQEQDERIKAWFDEQRATESVEAYQAWAKDYRKRKVKKRLQAEYDEFDKASEDVKVWNVWVKRYHKREAEREALKKSIAETFDDDSDLNIDFVATSTTRIRQKDRSYGNIRLGMDRREILSKGGALQKAISAREPTANIITILNDLKVNIKPTEKLLRETGIGKIINKVKGITTVDPSVQQLASEIISRWRHAVSEQKLASGTSTPNGARSNGTTSPAPKATPKAASPGIDPSKRNWKTDKVPKDECTNDTTRNNTIGLLYDGLASGSEKPMTDILDIAKSTESTVYNLPDVKRTTNSFYKEKIRSLYQNLKNKSNPTLRTRILSGVITPAVFAKMTPEEMKSAEMKEEDARMKKENLNNAMTPQEAQSISSSIECPKCHKKTVSYTQAQTRSADEPMTNFCESKTLSRLIRVY